MQGSESNGEFGFTDNATEAASGIRAAILKVVYLLVRCFFKLIALFEQMPFILELAAGTLPQETFQHYLIQDLLYLNNYSRVLAMLAARSEQTSDSADFLQRAQSVFKCEAMLHNGFLERYGLCSQKV